MNTAAITSRYRSLRLSAILAGAFASGLGAFGSSQADSALWNGKESVTEYAQRMKLAPTLVLDLGNNVKWEGVLVPAGKFIMGSPPGEAKTEEEAAQERQRQVTISQPFYIGKYETTQEQFEQIAATNPSPTKGAKLPVSGLTWKEIDRFCQKVGEKTGRIVSLPTEAQWEYSCRAGTTTPYHSGTETADLSKVGWWGGNSERVVQPVGGKDPNAWGVHDMHGNIREFVSDIYSAAPQGDAVDPTGPTAGDPDNHVVRGGSFTAAADRASNCRAASRRPTEGLASTGFRLAVAAYQPTQ